MLKWKWVLPGLLGIVSSLPVATMAAKPGGGGGADTTPPAQIGTITVQPAARALTLKFTAPGDDGNAGTAAGYDVFYTSGKCATSSQPSTWVPPSGWLRAPRSTEQKAAPAGSTEFFNVRANDGDLANTVDTDAGGRSAGNGLQAGTPYCVAIRARDEVPNKADWRLESGTPDSGVGGSWPLVARYPITGYAAPSSAMAMAYQTNFALPSGGGDALWAWLEGGSTDTKRLVFTSTSLRTVIPEPDGGDWWRVRLTVNPGVANGAGAVVDYWPNGTFSRYVAEFDGTTGVANLTLVASGPSESGGVAASQTGITYVKRSVNPIDEWDPFITVERVISKQVVSPTRTSWHTALDAYERISGQWQRSPTGLERDDIQPARYAGGFIQSPELFTRPDGTTVGFVAVHCGLTVYAERQSDGSFKFWDVGDGLAGSGTITRVAFSDTGAPVLARLTYYDGVIQINHPNLSRPPFTPPTSCPNNVSTTQPNAWETVTGVADPDLTYVGNYGVAGLAEQAGNVYLSVVAFQPNEKSADQRVVYRCNSATSWHVVSIDRTNVGRGAIGPVLDSGYLLRGYMWGYQEYVNGGPSYAPYPPDYVFLARQPNTLCP